MSVVQDRFFFPSPKEVRKLKEPYALSTIIKRLSSLSRTDKFNTRNLTWSLKKRIESFSEHKTKNYIVQIIFDCCDQNARLTLVSPDKDKYVIDLERSSTVHIHQKQNDMAVRVKKQKIEEEKDEEEYVPIEDEQESDSKNQKEFKDLKSKKKQLENKRKKEKSFKQLKKQSPITSARIGRSRMKRKINPNSRYFNEMFNVPKKLGKTICKRTKQEKRQRKREQVSQSSESSLQVVQKVENLIKIFKTRGGPKINIFLKKRQVIPNPQKNEQIPIVLEQSIRQKPIAHEESENKQEKINQLLQEGMQIEQKINNESSENQNVLEKNLMVQEENKNQIQKKDVQIQSMPPQLNKVQQIFSFKISGKQLQSHHTQTIHYTTLQPKPKYHSLNEQKISEKTINNYLVLEWLRKFTQKLSQKLTDTKASHKFDLNCIKEETLKDDQFSYFPVINQWEKFKQLWIESLDIIVEQMGFEKIEIAKPERQEENQKFNLTKSMFISKDFKEKNSAQENQKEDTSQIIYLSKFPINLKNQLENINVVLAYTISFELKVQLIWFSFYENSEDENNLEKFEHYFNQKSKANEVYLILERFLEYIITKRVKFIYTTLSKEIYTALYQLQKKVQLQKKLQVQNSSTQIIFCMHIECFKQFLDDECCRKNASFFKEISQKIRLAPNKDQIEQSYLYLVANSFNFDEKKQCLNPRDILKHFKIFSQVFSGTSNQSKNGSSDLSFLSTDFFTQIERAQIKDPVNQINKYFALSNCFRNQVELILWIFTIFDKKSPQCGEEANQSQVISTDIYWKEKEFLLYQKIFAKQEDIKGEALFTQILENPIYEFGLIVEHYPRLIVQVIYRFIKLSQSIQETAQMKNQNESNSNKSSHICQNLKNLGRFKVVHEPKKVQVKKEDTEAQMQIEKGKEQEEKSDEKNLAREKKWHCSCGFSQQTGIPCEHEIYFCISNKDSIYNELTLKPK